MFKVMWGYSAKCYRKTQLMKNFKNFLFIFYLFRSENYVFSSILQWFKIYGQDKINFNNGYIFM